MAVSYSPVVYEGKSYRSIKELCTHLEISPQRVYPHIRRGYTPLESVQIELDDKKFMSEGTEEERLSRKTPRRDNISVKYLAIHLNCSVEEAKIVFKREGFLYRGKPYKNIHILAEEKNMTVKSIGARMEIGDTFEQAVEFHARMKWRRIYLESKNKNSNSKNQATWP